VAIGGPEKRSCALEYDASVSDVDCAQVELAQKKVLTKVED
jgi:hypothetical protein